MDIRINPGTLSGTVMPPPSKSMAHRLIIAAALGGGISTVRNVAFSQDIEATLRCMTAMGADVGHVEEHILRIHGLRQSVPQACAPDNLLHFDCGESGSTLRFFIPLALDGRGPVRFVGHGRLMQRPLDVYEEMFRPLGVRWERTEDSLTV